jgi:NAD(P)-dependent dehydrogenase (short-subunit alcohol dehydrogenase family)
MRLLEKIALVTGGGGDIGGAQARLFARERARVVVTDVAEEAGQQVASDIAADGGSALFVRLDVSSESDWEAAVRACVDRFGGVDILVNNAGVYQTEAIEHTALDDWERVMGVNIDGAFLGTKAVIPSMRSRGGGAIVNVASTTALVGSKRSSAYGASKAALLSLSRHTAIQHAADGIRANTLVPGPVETEMIAENLATPEGKAASVARVPLGRLAAPTEIAYAALYLASDVSSYVTGSHLVVDGGLTAQ